MLIEALNKIDPREKLKPTFWVEDRSFWTLQNLLDSILEELRKFVPRELSGRYVDVDDELINLG